MVLPRTRYRRFLFMASVLGWLAMPHAALAQIADLSLPGSADPGRVLEDNRLKPRPDDSLQEAAPKKQAVPQVPEGADQIKFTLQGLWIEGMTAYDPAEFRSLYEPYIGKEISAATLFDIMGKVQQRYLDDGYALTKVVIPNQELAGGDVRLEVIEGHVGSVEVDKNIPPSPVIDDAVRRIASMRPLNVKEMERLMLILNDLPDSHVSAVLASEIDPAKQKPGAVRLILQKTDAKSRVGSISIDNHGSKFTGPWEAKASGSLYHIGPNYTELSVSGMVAAPFEEQRSASIMYSLPLFGASGTEVSLSASRTYTEPGSSLADLDIKGVAQNYEATISYPVIRQRDMTLRVDGAFEFKNSRTKILGTELYDDRLRTIKAGFNFNALDSWAGYSVVDLHYTQGLDIFGVREAGSVDLSRQDGKPDFQKFEMLAGRIQSLPWGLEAYGIVSGQYAFSPLLSSEEFGFGGGQIGRGYDSSEITGDHGFAASVELRYNTTVPAFDITMGLQPYVFYDIGKVWNIDNGADNKVSAASAGIGVRLNFGNDWSADLNFAKPLTRDADNEPKYQNDLGARVLFSLTKNF
jgi:hemolysin activation/secretion protein